MISYVFGQPWAKELAQLARGNPKYYIEKQDTTHIVRGNLKRKV
jgi:hypothetical protein